MPLRVIEDEPRVGAAICKKTQVEEQASIQSIAVDALEELLGHDHVGVDIGRW